MNADKGISIIRRTFSESSLKEALTRDIASQPRNTTEDNRVSLKIRADGFSAYGQKRPIQKDLSCYGKI